MAQLLISNLEKLNKLGLIIAQNISKCNLPPIFLKGELGVGKTTLVKAAVSRFPNAANAEIGSPSFNIYNLYPTTPPVFHCDLYRCQNDVPDELLEALEGNDKLVFLEWSEFLPKNNFPTDFLDISFNLDHYERLLDFIAHGENSKKLLELIIKKWQT